MTLALWFWIIYVIALIFFGWRNYQNRAAVIDGFVWWVLIALLGIGTFGSPIK